MIEPTSESTLLINDILAEIMSKAIFKFQYQVEVQNNFMT